MTNCFFCSVFYLLLPLCNSVVLLCCSAMLFSYAVTLFQCAVLLLCNLARFELDVPGLELVGKLTCRILVSFRRASNTPDWTILAGKSSGQCPLTCVVFHYSFEVESKWGTAREVMPENLLMIVSCAANLLSRAVKLLSNDGSCAVSDRTGARSRCLVMWKCNSAFSFSEQWPT